MKVKLCYGGESHGYGLAGILDGLPRGLKINLEMIKRNLARRRKGVGRGPRRKIEDDNFTIACGIIDGITTGGAIGFIMENRSQELRRQEIPRPGHVDLPGALKYETYDIDSVAERASARETAIRVLAGTICIQFLEHFGITITGWVEAIGRTGSKIRITDLKSMAGLVKKSRVSCPDPVASKAMLQEIKNARKKGETLGGIIRVGADGIIPGIGGISHPEKRLDSRLAAAIMSIPSVKGVEIGEGFKQARIQGSKAHDPILWDNGKFYHSSNFAGGIEGGITNGEMILVRAALKPISTLKKGLPSVKMKTKQEVLGPAYRSDVCAVPSAVVIAEAMTALVLADAYLEKFSGDSLKESLRNFKNYRDSIRKL
ncbi:MAG: chorismate synthase [Candidatus Eremiobacteraeota bacterium]|nr:chorismate synthase [Candidatus Eremiobacteraeota bacterium]